MISSVARPGRCDTELGKAKTDRSYRHQDVERLSADIGTYEATKAEQDHLPQSLVDREECAARRDLW